jgi:hypothetical protein
LYLRMFKRHNFFFFLEEMIIFLKKNLHCQNTLQKCIIKGLFMCCFWFTLKCFYSFFKGFLDYYCVILRTSNSFLYLCFVLVM